MFLFIIRHYDTKIIVRNISVGLHFWLPSTVTLSAVPVCTNFSTRSYNCLLYNFPPITLHTLQCSSAHCIISLYVLFLCQYCTCWYDVFHCVIKLFTVYICSLFRFVIFLSHHIRFAMPDLMLPFYLPSDLPHNHNNVYSPPTSCLSVPQIYWPCSTFFPMFFKGFSNIGFKCWMPCFFVSLLSVSILILLQPLMQS